jgi:hypothetical protein
MILNLNVPAEFNIHLNFSKIQLSFLMTFPKLWVNKSFDNVAYFKYVATKIADQNCMSEKTKKGLKYGKGKFGTLRFRKFYLTLCYRKYKD